MKKVTLRFYHFVIGYTLMFTGIITFAKMIEDTFPDKLTQSLLVAPLMVVGMFIQICMPKFNERD